MKKITKNDLSFVTFEEMLEKHMKDPEFWRAFEAEEHRWQVRVARMVKKKAENTVKTMKNMSMLPKALVLNDEES